MPEPATLKAPGPANASVISIAFCLKVLHHGSQSTGAGMAGSESRKSVVLNSWKEIASYLDRGVRTVQRWEIEAGLPVHRPRGHSRSAVLALSDEIEDWLRSDRNPEPIAKSNTSSRFRPSPESLARSRAMVQESMMLRERCLLLCSENKKALDIFLSNMQKLRNSLAESRYSRLASELREDFPHAGE